MGSFLFHLINQIMKKESGFTWKLGMFVSIGLAFFVVLIYLIGKQQNLFGSTFQLQTHFKTVSGLKVGNNVRFSGINVGTVDDIELVNDSSVVVRLVLKEDVHQFIKTDAKASIGSDGLMGDKVLTIAPGSASTTRVKDHGTIASVNAIEIEDIMKSVKKSVDNAGLITKELAQFTHNMNNKNGTLSKLLTDESFAVSIKNTMTHLETFSKGLNNKKGILSRLTTDEKLGKSVDSTVVQLNETVKAAQSNFLLKGYFKKKKKAAAKKQEEAIKMQEKMQVTKKLDSIKSKK